MAPHNSASHGIPRRYYRGLMAQTARQQNGYSMSHQGTPMNQTAWYANGHNPQGHAFTIDDTDILGPNNQRNTHSPHDLRQTNGTLATHSVAQAFGETTAQTHEAKETKSESTLPTSDRSPRKPYTNMDFQSLFADARRPEVSAQPGPTLKKNVSSSKPGEIYSETASPVLAKQSARMAETHEAKLAKDQAKYQALTTNEINSTAADNLGKPPEPRMEPEPLRGGPFPMHTQRCRDYESVRPHLSSHDWLRQELVNDNAKRTEENARRAAEYKKSLEAQRAAFRQTAPANLRPRTEGDKQEAGAASAKELSQNDNDPYTRDLSDWLELTKYYDQDFRENELGLFRKNRTLKLHQAEVKREEQELQQIPFVAPTQSTETTSSPSMINARLPLPPKNDMGIKIKDSALSSRNTTPILKRHYIEDDIQKVLPSPANEPTPLGKDSDRFISQHPDSSRSPEKKPRTQVSFSSRKVKRNQTCYNCGESGHYQYHCLKPRRDGKDWTISVPSRMA